MSPQGALQLLRQNRARAHSTAPTALCRPLARLRPPRSGSRLACLPARLSARRSAVKAGGCERASEASITCRNLAGMPPFRNRPPIWRRDVAVSFSTPCLLSSVETEESGIAAKHAAPPNLKRKSVGEPLLATGPPELKRRSVDPSEALSALSLFSVDDACMVLILSKLNGADVSASSCVCKRWRRLAGQERLWEALCRRDWGLLQPHTPQLQAASYRESYISWQRQFGRYGNLAVRARIAWWVIESWAAQHLPAIAATLRPGATEAALDEAEAALGVQLPAALRALYRVHDGQELPADAAADTTGECRLDAPSTLHGLFGGYSFYDQLVSLRLLPLRRLVLWTQRLREQVFKSSDPDSRVVFAASFNLKKTMMVDCGSGIVKACLADKRKACDAVPPDEQPGASDGSLRWFEEYAKRLGEGQYSVAVQPATPIDLGVPRTLAICLFPVKPPVWTWAITRGVRVEVTTIFVPELTRGKGIAADGSPTPPRFFFTYSTRLALLSEKGQRECGVAKPLRSVQLKSRHWIIRNASGAQIDEIKGDGVIGENPVLHAGSEAFTYSSCTPQPRLPTVLHGEFTFVKGLLSDPEAPRFSVRIPTVVLRLPTYIY